MILERLKRKKKSQGLCFAFWPQKGGWWVGGMMGAVRRWVGGGVEDVRVGLLLIVRSVC